MQVYKKNIFCKKLRDINLQLYKKIRIARYNLSILKKSQNCEIKSFILMNRIVVLHLFPLLCMLFINALKSNKAYESVFDSLCSYTPVVHLARANKQWANPARLVSADCLNKCFCCLKMQCSTREKTAHDLLLPLRERQLN